MNEASLRVGQAETLAASPDRGTVRVSVPIEGEMPEEWYGIFVGDLPGVTFYSDMPEMAFGDGRAVVYECRPDQLGRMLEHIKQRVETANRIYNTETLPKLRRDAEAKADAVAGAEAERLRLLAEADRIIGES